MIAKLTGILEEVLNQNLLLDVQGVGYDILCSSKTLSALPSMGSPLVLWVEMAFKTDHVVLYGFQTPQEKACFNMLLTVQGVGGKVALAILSALTVPQILSALEAKDHIPFTEADGVGGKLAQRLVHELKDKQEKWPQVAFQAQRLPLTNQDALSALLNLGYRKQDIEPIIAALAQETPALDLNTLLTKALQLLGKRL